VFKELGHRLGHAWYWALKFTSEVVEKPAGERLNLLAALPEWRNIDRREGQPLVEVSAKDTPGH
jgi:hypothetical protein